jgi:hypothetical protein
MPYSLETEEDILLGIRDLEAGNVSSKTEAARKHGILEATLRWLMKGRKSHLHCPVRGRKLTDEQELGLCLHIDYMNNICFPLHQENIDACANAISAQSDIDPCSSPEPVGSKWTMRFLLRHLEYKKCIQKSLDIDGLKAHQPEIIRIWFGKLKKALAKYYILLEDCHNMDETGFRIGTGGKQRIITQNTRQ